MLSEVQVDVEGQKKGYRSAVDADVVCAGSFQIQILREAAAKRVIAGPNSGARKLDPYMMLLSKSFSLLCSLARYNAVSSILC